MQVQVSKKISVYLYS